MTNSLRIAILLSGAIGSCISAANVGTHVSTPTTDALSNRRFIHYEETTSPIAVVKKLRGTSRRRIKESPFNGPNVIRTSTLNPFRLRSQKKQGIRRLKQFSMLEQTRSANTFVKKHRSEGNFRSNIQLAKKKATSRLHVGRNTVTSNLVKSRIVKLKPIEVEPALIAEELPFDFADNSDTIIVNATTQDVVHREDDRFQHRRKPLKLPSNTDIFKAFKYPLELRHKPAFCRRCFMFWRSVAAQAPNDKLYDYCCTYGFHSREFLREYLSPLTIIKFKL